MARANADLTAHGVHFANAFVENSLCCPSRASILTGDDSHTTGVYLNDPPDGGFASFHDRSTVATWLHAAGYRTALVGKYLNGYDGTYVPPGWDEWDAISGPPRYYGYHLNQDGALHDYGTAPPDYSTDVLASKAESFIRSTTGPLFLYLATWAPHDRPVPAPGDAHAFAGLPPWRPPNYDEADVSDKPRWVRDTPRLTPQRAATIDRSRILQYEALQAVDRAVDGVVRALSATGRLGSTMIVFASDNGLAWGEHRWADKQDAYEESIRIPLVIRYDPLTAQGWTDHRFALNTDLAPTFADLAGARAPRTDGRSLLPLLRSRAAPGRGAFLVEHLGRRGIPTFCAVRAEGWLFVAYVTGEEELYDLRSDPYELTNLAGRRAYAAERADLLTTLRGLCRPPPPGLTLPGA